MGFLFLQKKYLYLSLKKTLNNLIIKKMKTIFSVFILINIILVYSQSSFACLNGETKRLKNGDYIYEDVGDLVPYGHMFVMEDNDYKEIIKDLDKLYRKTNDVDYLSDKGYVLILQGKYEEAVKLYIELEKIKPNRYSTASNLGTAYELLGENEKALFWIKKSFEIDPTSHNNSEWLHVNILEAKIKGGKYVNSDFLITTNFGQEKEPKTDLSRKTLLKLRTELFFQLNERMSFIKDKNEIVALLLFDLGNLHLLVNSPYEAKETYQSAINYGLENSLIKERLRLSEERIKQSKVKKTDVERVEEKVKEEIENYYLEITASILFLLIVTFIGIKYIINRKTKSKF
jgi:tetratricopeptide (TPR) repeat protein